MQRAPRCSASTITAPTGRSSASAIICPCRRRMQPRQRLLAHRRQALPCWRPAPSSGRIVFGGNDRPGVMLAGAVRTYVNRYGVLPGRARRDLHHRRRRLARRRRSRGRRRAGRGRHRSAARRRRRRLRARGRSAGARVVCRRRTSRARTAAAALEAHRGRRRRRARARRIALRSAWPCRAAGIRTCTSTTHLGAPAGLGRGHRTPSCPATCPPAWSSRAPRPDDFTLAACAGRRRAAGAEAAARLRLHGGGRATRPRPTARASRVTPLWRVGERRRARPSSISRTTSPPRMSSSPQREGFRVGRASQALHHARHGDRPGQDLERRRPRHHGRADAARRSPRRGTTIFRPPYTPVAIGALAGHHRGKDFRPTRLTPPHDWCAGAGRRLRRGRPVAARRSGSRGPARPTGSRASPAR